MTHFGHLDPALLNGRLIHPLLLNCGCAKVNKFPVTQKSSHMRTTVLEKPAAFLILVPLTYEFRFHYAFTIINEHTHGCANNYNYRFT